MIDISLEGSESWPETMAMIAVMEREGVETVWLASHLFQREPIARAAAILSASRSLSVALMAISPYTVHPVYAAMAAADLADIVPVRLPLCLGLPWYALVFSLANAAVLTIRIRAENRALVGIRRTTDS